jgi:hypothetical protein
MALSTDFQDLVSFLLTVRATGALTLALAGLTPAEYTSLKLDIQSCVLFRFLQRPPSALKRAVAFGQPNSFLHGPMVLFDYVVEIFALA